MKNQIGFSLWAVFLAMAIPLARGQSVVYVNAAATGGNSGVNWANAYTNLQTAMQNTGSGTQLWVASGTYYPGANRTDSFTFKTNMYLYGGLTNGMTALTDRNWTSYPTILSGEIQRDGNISNNSYHILIGASNAILDGFTVTLGFANGAAYPDNSGSGIIISNVTAGTQTLANCTFTFNGATNGGAVFASDSYFLIVNSLFVSNSATSGAGGALYANMNNASRTFDITNCLFRQNSAGVGGALYLASLQRIRIETCRFISNRATGNSGAIDLSAGGWYQFNPGVTNCLFVGNSAGGNGGCMYDSVPLSNSRLIGNSAGGVGGAIYMFNAGGNIANNCMFVGNSAASGGGGMYGQMRSYVIGHCLFAGNITTNGNGGGLYYQGGWDAGAKLFASNNTYSGNWAKNGGAVAVGSTNVIHISSIMWGNPTTNVSANELSGNTNICYYCDVRGGWTNGANNINEDPRFAGGPSGTWTGVGNYDSSAGQTVLTDGAAAWTAGAFAGLCINTDTSQYLQLLIVTNTATTITVWGDAAAFTTAGDAYQVWDYHLKSRGGRWTPQGWTFDIVHSHCIDSGDPASAYALEPLPNGSRINMGFEGNTLEASKSLPSGTIFYGR